MGWRRFLFMPSAANYGAKVGQAIRGNLGRGTGGRFSRAGSASAAAQPQTVTTAEITAAAGMSPAELEALRSLASGQPMSESQVATLEAAGLAQRNSDGKLVRTSAARSFMSALKRGDVQAMTEALSNARERQAKKAAKGAKGKAPKAKKPTSEERQAARRQAQNDGLAAAMDAAGHEDVELQAEFVSFARGEADLSEANADSLVTQGLVEANADGTYRLTKEGRSFVTAAYRGDKRGSADAAKRAADIAERKAAKAERDMTTKEAPAVLSGEDWRDWRWVLRSASNFRDVHGQHISLTSLEAAHGMGEGPLLWWHEYDDEEDGQGLPVVLGWADFGAVHSGCLIESGTFVCKEAAEFVDANADDLAVSSGFWNYKDDVQRGVFRGPIAIAERSLMETGRQANGLADLVIVIKGAEDMKPHKKSALIRLAGAQNVEAILANTEARVRAAQHIGLTQMEAEAQGAPATTGDPVADEAPITPSSEAIVEAAPVADTVVETPVLVTTGETEAQTGQQGGEVIESKEEQTAFLLGDMTPAEFTTMLGATIAQALAAVVPQLASAQLTTKSADDIVALTKKVDDLTKRLEDETPSGGYRPAGDPDQIVQKQAGAAPVGPQEDPGMAAARALVDSLSGQPGQRA